MNSESLGEVYRQQADLSARLHDVMGCVRYVKRQQVLARPVFRLSS